MVGIKILNEKIDEMQTSENAERNNVASAIDGVREIERTLVTLRPAMEITKRQARILLLESDLPAIEDLVAAYKKSVKGLTGEYQSTDEMLERGGFLGAERGMLYEYLEGIGKIAKDDFGMFPNFGVGDADLRKPVGGEEEMPTSDRRQQYRKMMYEFYNNAPIMDGLVKRMKAEIAADHKYFLDYAKQTGPQ